jgi:hypothetical protein
LDCGFWIEQHRVPCDKNPQPQNPIFPINSAPARIDFKNITHETGNPKSAIQNPKSIPWLFS